MFYGAEDKQTAISEITSHAATPSTAITVGQFQTARDTFVVDLTGLQMSQVFLMRTSDISAQPSSSSESS